MSFCNKVPRIFNVDRNHTVLSKFHADSFSPEVLLGKDNISKTIARLKCASSIRLQTQEPFKKSSIMIPFCTHRGEVCLIYTVRHTKTPRDAAHFPGGELEARDRSLTSTAVRKTAELLNVSSKAVKVWSIGNVVVTKSDVCIYPVVGQILVDVHVDELQAKDDVAEVFIVPVRHLCDYRKNGYTQFKDGMSAPVYGGAKRRIWGLTAIMTNYVLAAFVSPQAYKHKLKMIPVMQKRMARDSVLRKI